MPKKRKKHSKDTKPTLSSPPDKYVFDEFPVMSPGDVAGEPDADATSDEPFEFECSRRERLDDGTWKYFVQPILEYDDLDFKGHTIIINGRERKCIEFEVSDDGHIIIVA